MSTLGITNPSFLDWAKSYGPDGKYMKVAEVLAQTNQINTDAVWQEANGVTGHTSSIRSGYSDATWRKLYQFVQPSKSTKTKIVDTIGSLHKYSEVDVEEANLNGDANLFRADEDAAAIEEMNQEFAETLFYGNETTAPAEFTGFAPRFNSLSAENASNIISGGSNDTDNSSIWLIGWSPQTVFCTFPKGSKAGLQIENKGQVTSQTSDGLMEVYRSHFVWSCGLVVRDWRYVVRIPNIEVSDLLKTAATGADLPDLMAQALEVVPSLENAKFAFYMNRTLLSMLRRQIEYRVGNSTLTMDMVGGKHVYSFAGIPVRRCDAITNTESLVS